MVNLYREELPCNCPPDDAEEVMNQRIMYRLIRGTQPSCSDFESLRKTRPDLIFPEVEECIACGISLFDSIEAAKSTVKYKLGKCTIYEVHLRSGAGRIKRTRGIGHFTLWPYRDYNLICSTRPIER